MPLGTAGSQRGAEEKFRLLLVPKIDEYVSKVQEIQIGLPDNVTPQWCNSYAAYFTRISITFVDYTRRKGNKFHFFLNSGDGQKEAAKNIINCAKRVAKLFERYSKRPASYSKVDCGVEIAALLAELANLRFYCRSQH